MQHPLPKWPERQAAIVANKAGDLVISRDALVPEIQPDMLLLKTVVVAVNPVDVKMTGPMAMEGGVAGSDLAGVVVMVGSDVPAGQFVIGDRVCAPVAPMNPLTPRIGAFAEYVAVEAAAALKLPDHITIESGATMGISVAIIGYALFRSLQVPGRPENPATKPAYIFVYGGSTTCGTMAIQLIKRSGLIPITTCSPKNFALVESYGAEKAFNYHDPSCADEIKAYTRNALAYALDCYCDGSSMRFCYAVIGRAGGRYTTLEPYAQSLHTRKRVKPEWILGSALWGKDIAWKEPYTIKGDPELADFGREWFRTAQRLLDCGEIRPHPARLGDKIGFEAVLEGLQLLKSKAVSGEKLVYRIQNE